MAIAFWVAVGNSYGFSDGNDISLYYEEWIGPMAVFLAHRRPETPGVSSCR